ncbi:hypothetical protein Tco_0895051 [Tanacetum coccineum]|uniref:Uncharacterized protein n=1 Tax=Tanacetum coccineum TaxID=301880 RepID=A0ABQ5CEQ4_9ASTR
MCILHLSWIMSEGLNSRRKPSNPEKISNSVGRVKGLKVFLGNFTYECDFVVLEDTTSVIGHYLGSMVLGKPFVEASGLVYDKEALGGNTRDLDSIWEETGQDCNFTRSGFKNMHTVPGDDIAIPSDAVRTYKRRCRETDDGVRTKTPQWKP